MITMVTMVTSENTSETWTIPQVLLSAAGTIRTGIKGSQGQRIKIVKRIQGVILGL